MKKLALSLDDLQVESFGTTPRAEKRGTVVGNDDTVNYCPWTGMASCGQTVCSCSEALETCAPECPLSYHTDCHRC